MSFPPWVVVEFAAVLLAVDGIGAGAVIVAMRASFVKQARNHK